MGNRIIPTVAAALAVVCVSCASSAGGGSQMENTVYSTHRMVQNLDRNLGDSVTRLNQTTAELLTRVEAGDRETRQLLSLVEENQHKLEQLQRRLDELTVTLYRQMDLSPPADAVSRQPMTSPFPESAPPQPAPGTPAPPRDRDLDAVSGDVVVQPPAEDLMTAGREPGPPPALTGAESEALYMRARELYSNEDYVAALQQFEQYLQLYPNSANTANAQYWKAHCYFKLDDFERAIEEFQTLDQRYPGSGHIPIALHNEAVAFSRLGENERAMATFERLIQRYPNDVVADMARDKLQQLRQMTP